MAGLRRIWVLSAALACLGAVPAGASAAVVLNEVNSCEGGDWIEIVNTGDEAADVSGWLLTDDPLDQDPPRPTHRMLFAEGTEIGASGSIVLIEGDGPNEFPFGIGCGGDHVRLADETGAALVDEVATPDLQLDGLPTWGRYPSGTGEFALTAATQGSPNMPFGGGGGPGPDPAAWLFDPSAVVEIDLGLPPESVEELEEEPEEYVEGSFALATTGGTYELPAVGIRLKGGIGSFRELSGKAAFKVKFNHSVSGQRFLGLKTLTLNSMVQDPSMVHEVLAYSVFRELGIPAARTGYAYVRVNDADYGVYLNVETVDDVSLPRWFDSTQHLYEGEYGLDVVPGDEQAFEVDEGDEEDRSDLEALVAAAGQPTADWAGQLAPVLDLGQAVRMWAIEKYIGHWDGYAAGLDSPELLPNNYYLHSDEAGRFTLLPWGTDRTWEQHLEFDRHGGILFLGCLDDPACAALYREAVAEVRAAVPGLGLAELVTATAATLEPWQQQDPRREHSLDQIEAGVAGVLAFLEVRPFGADGWLNPQSLRAAPARPRTRITARPKAVTVHTRVGFEYRSDLAGSSFECKLDSRPFRLCASPLRLRVGAGRHRFQVRAVAPSGLRDATAAEFRFEVRPRRAR